MSTTNVAIVNEFVIDAHDYHEFISIRQNLQQTVGLIYSFKEIEPTPYGKVYRARFTFKGIRNPAQYSKDIE